MWVYLPYLTLTEVPDDPGWLYDEWANVYIDPTDPDYQRCARTAIGDEPRVMAITLMVRAVNPPGFIYIVICKDAQAWALGFQDRLTLYDIMDFPPELISHMNIDAFRQLDFALLTQTLHTPIVLDGERDTASQYEVTGYATCQRAADPGNAGT